jgi:cyclophilin family peptidyl-prolyl cis-trans isomerase
MRMRRFLVCLLSLASLALAAAPKPRVKLTTSMGTIVIELEPQAAPKTVANFLKYVRKGQYKGTIFHRVIPGFMIQGGGYVDYLGKKYTEAPIPNEADRSKAAGLRNRRGMVAMARTGDPDGATAEFFINLVNNPSLDFKSKKDGNSWGYCVFGKVVQGMDVVDRIAHVKISHARSDFPNLPVKPVIIQDAAIL